MDLCFLFFLKSGVNSSLLEMGPSLISMICSLATNFMICEVGQQLTSQFSKFNETLCRCKWYSFPIELQQMLVIVMSNTQQLAFMQSYGNIPCTRESFKVVCHIKFSQFQLMDLLNLLLCGILLFQSTRTGFSYFMTLRQIDG